MSRKVLRFAYASVAVSVLAQAADAPRLNIKPGLWEVATTPKVTGEMPIPDDQLAKMPPERRARLEAAMKASMNNQAKPRVYKECMTPEKLARGFDIEKSGTDSSCKRTVVTSSSSSLQLHDECTRPQGKTVSDINFKVAGGTRMSGKINLVMVYGTHTMKVDSTVQGKWLGANCGTVKDAELEK